MTDTTAKAPQHHAVVHPRDLLPRTGRGLKWANDKAANLMATIYGAAITIWVFVAYSIMSGLTHGAAQVTELTWSNGVQLVFCAVMTYVGVQIGMKQAAKEDADHAALTHIATVVDRIDQRTGGGR